MSRFKRALREQRKLRAGFAAPAGGGKTMTMLRFAMVLAHHLARKRGNSPPPRVAGIDTEHSSMALYQGLALDGIPFEFDVLSLTTYNPLSYAQAIIEAGKEGYDCLIIDSLSHAWIGVEGALELVNKQKNPYTAWKDVTPMHNRMVEAILTSPCHVFASIRSKMAYVLEKNDKGKEVPVKVGMEPIQRQGMEYEFDVFCELDTSHVMTVTKSRCPEIEGRVEYKPGAPFMQQLIEWLEAGTVAPTSDVNILRFAADEQVRQIVDKLHRLNRSRDVALQYLQKRYHVSDFTQLTATEATEYERRLDTELGVNTSTPAANPPAATAPGSDMSADEIRAFGALRDRWAAACGFSGDTLAAQWRQRLSAAFSVDSVTKLTADQRAQFRTQLEDEIQRTMLPAGQAGQPAAADASPTGPAATLQDALAEQSAGEPPSTIAQAAEAEAADQAEIAQAAAAVAPQDTPAPAAAGGETITAQQMAALTSLKGEFFSLKGMFDPAQIGPAWSKVLDKRGVKRDKDLTQVQAAELLEAIYTQCCAMAQAQGKAAPPRTF